MTILSSSSRIRSAETMESRPCMRSTAAIERGVGLEREAGREARRAQHAQRVVAERDLRVERRAQPPRRQVAQPVEGVDELHVGQAERQRVDGEVPPRQVDVDVVPEADLGLARLGHVDLGPVRRDLVDPAVLAGTDRAEACPLQPDVVGPAAHQALRLVGAGVGRQVDVGARLGPGGEQRVTHGAAHEIQRPPGAREAARQLLGGADEGAEPLGHRRGLHPPTVVAASSLSLCRRAGPGPPSARSPWPPQPSSERRARAPRVPPTRPADGRAAARAGLADPVGHARRALVQHRLRRRRGAGARRRGCT